MKQFLFMIAIIAIFISFFSCTREEHQYVDPASSMPVFPAGNTGYHRPGGEDDDKQIIIHRVYSSSQAFIPGASVRMIGAYSRPDTITGTTNIYGECLLELPKDGEWSVLIECAGYRPSQQLIIVSDSVSTRNVTLEQEN